MEEPYNTFDNRALSRHSYIINRFNINTTASEIYHMNCIDSTTGNINMIPEHIINILALLMG